MNSKQIVLDSSPHNLRLYLQIEFPIPKLSLVQLGHFVILNNKSICGGFPEEEQGSTMIGQIFDSECNTTGMMMRPSISIPEFSVYNIIARVLMSLLAGAANLGIILAFAFNPGMRAKPANLIILSLAVADFGSGVVLLPIHATTNSLGRWALGSYHACRIFIFVESWLLQAGIFHILLLSWDRYLLLYNNYPVYIRKQRKVTVLRLIIFTWSCSLIPSILEQALWNHNTVALLESGIRINYNIMCFPPTYRRLHFALLFNTLFRVLPVCTSLFFGVLFVVGLLRELKSWKRVGPLACSNRPTLSSSRRSGPDNNRDVARRNIDPVQNEILKRRYIKPIITYLVLLVLFVFCTFPMSAYVVVINSFCKQCFGSQHILYLLNLLYFNSCLNPIAYFLLNRRLRHVIGRCCFVVCCRPCQRVGIKCRYVR